MMMHLYTIVSEPQIAVDQVSEVSEVSEEEIIEPIRKKNKIIKPIRSSQRLKKK